MSEHTPKLSISLTCKDHAHYLRETLDSILAQSFKDFEVCIVDGCSTDDTVSILKEYADADKRIRWVSEPDEGMDDGFYKAMKMCRGEYWANMPVSDIFLSRTWLRECVAILDNNPNISLVHGNWVLMDDNGGIYLRNYDQNYDYLTIGQPSGEESFPYVIGTGVRPADLTVCARRDIYLKYYPPYDPQNNQKKIYEAYCKTGVFKDEYLKQWMPINSTFYFMIMDGCQQYHIPRLAVGVRRDGTTLTEKYRALHGKTREVIKILLDNYWERVRSGKIKHVFREGSGRITREVKNSELIQLEKEILNYRVNSKRVLFKTPLNLHQSNRYELMKTIAGQLLSKADQWESDENVYIYGAGSHTIQLLVLLKEKIACKGIIDRKPSEEQLYGLPVYSTDEFDFNTAHRIIISSETYEKEIYDRLLHIHKVDKEKIVTFYHHKHVMTSRYERKIINTGQQLKKAHDIPASAPVIIGGCQKSGTTLFSRVLDNHSNLAVCDETWLIEPLARFFSVFYASNKIHKRSGERYSLYSRYARRFFTRRDIADQMTRGIDNLMTAFTTRKGKKRWVDETPGNCLWWDVWYELFPQAKFIHIIRDGRDVVSSGLSRGYYSLEGGAKTWAKHIVTSREKAKALPDPEGTYFEIKYEDLVLNTENTLRLVTDFIGETFEPKMLELPKVSGFVNNWGSEAALSSPIGRWKKDPVFTEANKGIFKKIAGDLLTELEYEMEDDW